MSGWMRMSGWMQGITIGGWNDEISVISKLDHFIERMYSLQRR